MKIQVLGSGCATCKKLFDLTREAVEALNSGTEVEYVTGEEGVRKIVAMGLMQSPVLAIDGKPVLVGRVPDAEKLRALIAENLR